VRTIRCAGCGVELQADAVFVLCLLCEEALDPQATRASLRPTRFVPVEEAS
jgi:hypothetical protein